MRNRRGAILWVGAVAYAAAIFVASHQPVPLAVEGVAFGDKALHVLEYAGLATLLALALGSTPSPALRPRASLIAATVAIAYAASDEVHQALVGRHGDVTDFLADGAGAVVAAVVHEAWRRWAVGRAAVSDTSPR